MADRDGGERGMDGFKGLVMFHRRFDAHECFYSNAYVSAGAGVEVSSAPVLGGITAAFD